MKKIFALALTAALMFPSFAADEEETNVDEIFESNTVVAQPQKTTGVWPAFLAVGNIPPAKRTPDVIGLRFTIPYSTAHDSVTGFDLGFWGRAQYFEGFMLNILRNDVRDQLAGIQVGLYNSAAQADMVGIQVGLWNEAGSIRGLQVGLVNTVDHGQGFQIGLINRAEELYGFQVGVINVIRDAELQFCPAINIGF